MNDFLIHPAEDSNAFSGIYLDFDMKKKRSFYELFTLYIIRCIYSVIPSLIINNMSLKLILDI